MKILKVIKNILTSKEAIGFYWVSTYGFIGIIITGIAKLDWCYAPMIIAFLNGVSKYINTNYIQR